MQENDTRPDGRELGEFRQMILNVGQYLRHCSDVFGLVTGRSVKVLLPQLLTFACCKNWPLERFKM